ncbi:MAG: hypothetical protein KJO01_08250 [Gammaproteobacteria bacterium]|nr:hypothetical protein [Gammaproteobacteria bacterium]MBT8111625.1 hypothetical protein [Gammaproteobacteria bacterium]NNL46323.1 hypothetical protein [Woeseiaceae bacterium]
MTASVATLETELVAEHGDEQRQRIQRGLDQVADFWREEDGGRDAFEAFIKRHFAGDEATLEMMFARYEKLLEQLDGHSLEILLAFREQSDLDLGPIMPYDEIFAAYDPFAHFSDDFFANKLAFVVLLNFPITSLAERLEVGDSWSRTQWAQSRLADRYAKRIPADVQQAVSSAGAIADQYIAEYNIFMHHLVTEDGERLFPAGMKLLSHWNLRDEIKANYSSGDEAGLARQRMVQKVMERIVDQTIPNAVINNPHVDWNPYSNDVRAAVVSDTEEPAPADLSVTNAPEPDKRYEVLLGTYRAARQVDPYSPTAPTHIDRSFSEGREIPEKRVIEMFESVLSSDLLERTGRLIETRLGRPLQPFDIWYNGFRARGAYSEADLDAITRKRYPTAAAFEADMPNLLVGLGFDKDRAQELAANIVVEPARGSGHAWGAGMRDAKTHLRTRVGADGMDYKGFNIAVHEMGHNVEQTISLNDIDHYMLQGVPNTAFTEALAFVFQARDLELLGLASPGDEARALATLDDFWGTAEIAAVALVDIGVWHWMYENPEATPAQLKAATLRISTDVWNRYYAPVFGVEDVTLLGIYSHMIHSFLYLPNYPVGGMIAHQIEEQIAKSGDLGAEFERMCRAGNIAPDLWMKNATGQAVGPDALLNATASALQTVAGQ